MHILLKKQIIELKDNMEINQGKKEENFSYSRINPSTNLQFYNNSSKVVILQKKRLRFGYPLILTRELVTLTFEITNYKIKRQH